MRNLIWLFGIVCCIAVSARFHPQPPATPVAIEKGEEFAILWQEWGTIPGEVFVFRGTRQGSQAFVPTYRGSNPEVKGPPIEYLYQKLRPELEAALAEPCRGAKTRELTLTEGSQTLSIEIGTYAGSAQARIVEIMEKSDMPALRAQFQNQPVKP